jgi:hypothetical protein
VSSPLEKDWKAHCVDSDTASSISVCNVYLIDRVNDSLDGGSLKIVAKNVNAYLFVWIVKRGHGFFDSLDGA